MWIDFFVQFISNENKVGNVFNIEAVKDMDIDVVTENNTYIHIDVRL